MTVQSSNVVAAVALLAFVGLVESSCGSRPSENDRFRTGLKSACESYAADLKTITQHAQTARASARAGGVSTATFRAEQRWLEQLRGLNPPASSGVTVSEWQKAIAVQLGDTRASVALYGKQFAKVEQSWNRPLRKPKLPPGTGPTATAIAQALNSPEGRRFVRLQNRLWKQLTKHSGPWLRMLKATGMQTTCARTNGTAPTTTHS